jgi:hypothetical protein
VHKKEKEREIEKGGKAHTIVYKPKAEGYILLERRGCKDKGVNNQENRRFSRFPPTWPLVPLPCAPCPLFLVSGVVGGIALSS